MQIQRTVKTCFAFYNKYYKFAKLKMYKRLLEKQFN